MENNNLFVMICGPAASGKTTLIERMGDKLSAYIYKPSKAYIDLAKEREIPFSKAFDEVNQEDALDYFCSICKNNGITIGDQHLAIQPNKDSAIASGNVPDDAFNEAYVPGISYDLIDRLQKQGIKVLLIYLKASPEELFKRAYQRNKDTGMYIRNKNIQEVIDEICAEEYFFNELITNVNIDYCIIESDMASKEEVLNKALEKTMSVLNTRRL